MLEKPPAFTYKANTISRMNDTEIAASIKEINNNYLYWDKVKYKKISNLTPQQIWEATKFVRLINYKQLSFYKYSFKYYTTDFIQKSLHQFDMHIGGYMGAKSIIPENNKARYLVSSIMEEAISSSIMEGAATTRKKAKEMLRKDIKPKNKSDQMIVNNYHTINHIVTHKNDDLTPEKLLYIHNLMCKKTLVNDNDEGAFRTSNDVYVVNHATSDVVHTPPTFDEIQELIKALCKFFNTDAENDFVHPIIKGIIIHFMVAWIHPFVDGNGRTARALLYWYLLKKGYWLTEYLSISKIIQSSKKQYENAYLYTEQDDLDISYFITYHINVMHKAFDALKKYIQEKQKENLQITEFLKIENINERQAQILKMLYDEPELIFSVKEIATRFSITDNTARTDLLTLVGLGFMQMIPVNKVKSNFIRSNKFHSLIKSKLNN
jgi:Fic family protein